LRLCVSARGIFSLFQSPPLYVSSALTALSARSARREEYVMLEPHVRPVGDVAVAVRAIGRIIDDARVRPVAVRPQAVQAIGTVFVACITENRGPVARRHLLHGVIPVHVEIFLALARAAEVMAS